jgi:Plasmid pRiA4b ORF-3-like protein
MLVYEFRVSIIGINRLYRVIEASEDCTFEDLHDAIFDAFDRSDPHLYSFFITKSDTKNIRSIWNAPEITHPQNTEDLIGYGREKMSAAETRIGNVGLSEKDVFHYLFDFGDDWWHRIRVQTIKEKKNAQKDIKIIKSLGKSPQQYSQDDDFFDDEYE